jgi:hypothetical protein
MKIINLSQTNDTDEWLQERIGRITGTKSRNLALEHYPKTDAKNKRLKVGIDFWKFLAETMAEQPTNENPMERGHRLEPENILLTLQQLGVQQKDCVTDCGIWESDEDPRIACSPDAYQASTNPTWAIECKSLGSAYHLQAVIPWMVHSRLIRHHTLPEDLAETAAQVLPAATTSLNATGIDFIPDAYRAQAIQYFVVCDTLETLYFSMYDPRIYASARHQIIPVCRKDIQPLITEHKRKQLNTLHIIDTLTKMTGASF